MTLLRSSDASPRPVRHVVFDWNGTLIDDCALAVATVNTLRGERGMPAITREHYRSAFRFPIAAFYRGMGFDVDGDEFSALMRRYLVIFNAKIDDCPLHNGAREALTRLRAAALGVHILSASHRDTLRRSLAAKGLTGAFDEVAGLRDSLASDKRGLGQELAHKLGAEPAAVLYVGDTDHDHEVAAALGWRFLFVDHGHQAADRIAGQGAAMITALEQIFLHLDG